MFLCFFVVDAFLFFPVGSVRLFVLCVGCFVCVLSGVVLCVLVCARFVMCCLLLGFSGVFMFGYVCVCLVVFVLCVRMVFHASFCHSPMLG